MLRALSSLTQLTLLNRGNRVYSLNQVSLAGSEQKWDSFAQKLLLPFYLRNAELRGLGASPGSVLQGLWGAAHTEVRPLPASSRTSHFRCWRSEEGVGLKVTTDKATAKADACGAAS